MRNSSELQGHVILVVEDEPLIALDLKTTLEAAGAKVICQRTKDAAQRSKGPDVSAAVLDVKPGTSDHRTVARQLKARSVPFLFYSTHPPEDVSTVRGAPMVSKPERAETIVTALAQLLRR